MTTATFHGTLVARPEVRYLPAGKDGLPVPVLCLRLRNEGLGSNPITVQQHFKAGATRQCEAAARRLKPGQQLTVEAPLTALQLTVAGAAHIHTEKKKGNP
ncbi:hypothetical protein ACFSF0_00390 [Ottowia flava]|uniref:Primosomal replication protein N n=1 Tax=Ottowia flava TaxID=2675430 RepID=A0ABW4KM07_9BURK|nr:hypothetical protein [Ottowia sp. GY511]